MCTNLCFLYLGAESLLACWEPGLGFRRVLNAWALPSIAWFHGKIPSLTKATNSAWVNNQVTELA